MAVPELTVLMSLEPLVMAEPEVTARVALELQVSALVPHEPEVMAEPQVIPLVYVERYVP